MIVREILYLRRTPPADDTDPDETTDEPGQLPRPPLALTATTPTAPEAELLPAALVQTGHLGLDGPGAPNAARAILVTVLTGHHRHRERPDRPWPGRIIATAAGLRALDLPTDLLAGLPQVTIADSPADAAHRLDVEALHRRRLMTATDTDSITALRAAVPDEMFPTMLLLTDTDSAPATTGRRGLGLFTLALGHRPDLPVVTLDADGHQTDPADGHGSSWWQLTAADATDLLQLAAAAADIPTPTPAARPTAHGTETPPALTPVRQEPAAASTPAGTTAAADARAPAAGDRPAAADRRVRLVLFGHPTLIVDGEPRTAGILAKSLEVAAYLALHPDGATGDRLAVDLLPNKPTDKARNSIYRAVVALRGIIHDVTGEPGSIYLTSSKTAGYQLNPDRVSVDLWDFDAAHKAAGRATTDPDRITALSTAADLARAHPLGDTAYLWATAHTADIDHHMIDVLADLADLYADDHPDRALACLEQAITLAPHVEDLYAHVMRIHAARRRPDAVRRTYQRLRDALEHLDLDVEPTPDTRALLARLTRPQPPALRSRHHTA